MTSACPSTLGAVKPTFESPSLLIGRAADDGVDAVAVAQRVLQPLQHHRPHAVAKDGALRLLVERTAVAVG